MAWRRPFTSFGFGYAVMTVHKAQGSEWGNVVLIDECYRPEVRKAWLYTGITRAAGKLTISNYPIDTSHRRRCRFKRPRRDERDDESDGA